MLSDHHCHDFSACFSGDVFYQRRISWRYAGLLRVCHYFYGADAGKKTGSDRFSAGDCPIYGNVDALACQTDDYTFGLFILTPSDAYDKAAEKKATELIKSIDFIYAESVDMAMTDYFQVLTPERWKYLCHYETTETENGGYKLTYYNEDVPVLTLEARYYDGEDQPLDSVWQGYLGRIETVDGKKYDLLSTISQYSEDASDEWKEMYDTYLDTINGIRMMDGCSLTEGSHT